MLEIVLDPSCRTLVVVLLNVVAVPFAVKFCNAAMALAVALAWAVVVATAAVAAAFEAAEYSSHANTPPPMRSKTSRTTDDETDALAWALGRRRRWCERCNVVRLVRVLIGR
jgi:hypothetical protein